MKLIYSILLILLVQPVIAQTDTTKVPPSTPATTTTTPAPQPEKTRRDQRPFIERISLGGGVSYWINATQSYLELAPVLAYRFPKALVTGIGYRYIFRHQRVYGKDLNAYGPNLFARLAVTRRIYLWTEYESLQNESIYTVGTSDIGTKYVTTESVFAGLGYLRSFGKKGRGGLSLQVLYNFLYDRDDALYYSPVTYRVGYYF